MPDINIKVSGKIASAPREEYIVCDNSDYMINFDFSEEWSEYETKTMQIVLMDECGCSHTFNNVIFSGNSAELPTITNARAISIGVFAGDLITTTAAVIVCRPSIRSHGGVPTPPTQEEYDEIMELLNAIQRRVDGYDVKYWIEEKTLYIVGSNTAVVINGNTLYIGGTNDGDT